MNERITRQQYYDIVHGIFHHTSLTQGSVEKIVDEVLTAVGIEVATPPAPRVRPYKPAEAAAHLGRQFVYSKQPRTLGSVTSSHIYPMDRGREMSFECFASHCTWADTGEPCGILEPTPEE